MEPKKIYRDTDKKIIAGVCAGLAEYLEVDVVLVRAASVLFALSAGGGILAYILAIFIIPPKPKL